MRSRAGGKEARAAGLVEGGRRAWRRDRNSWPWAPLARVALPIHPSGKGVGIIGTAAESPPLGGRADSTWVVTVGLCAEATTRGQQAPAGRALKVRVGASGARPSQCPLRVGARRMLASLPSI